MFFKNNHSGHRENNKSYQLTAISFQHFFTLRPRRLKISTTKKFDKLFSSTLHYNF